MLTFSLPQSTGILETPVVLKLMGKNKQKLRYALWLAYLIWIYIYTFLREEMFITATANIIYQLNILIAYYFLLDRTLVIIWNSDSSWIVTEYYSNSLLHLRKKRIVAEELAFEIRLTSKYAKKRGLLRIHQINDINTIIQENPRRFIDDFLLLEFQEINIELKKLGDKLQELGGSVAIRRRKLTEPSKAISN